MALLVQMWTSVEPTLMTVIRMLHVQTRPARSHVHAMTAGMEMVKLVLSARLDVTHVPVVILTVIPAWTASTHLQIHWEPAQRAGLAVPHVLVQRNATPV